VLAEESRKLKTQMLNGILSHLPVVAGRINERGVITEATGLGLRRFQLADNAIVGMDVSERPEVKTYLQRALAGESVNFSCEGTHQGQPWHFHNYLFFDAEMGKGAIFFARDVTRRKELEKQILDISAQEQGRIGRDLHDGLGQHLTGIACLSSALQARLKGKKGNNDLAEQAAAIANLVQEAIQQTRALARGLCPVQIESEGLQSALEDLAYTVQHVHKVKCRLEANTGTVADHAVSMHLYRIAQEAVNNALKHATPKSIAIRLWFSDDENSLTITDDGNGFVEQDSKHPSLGLRMMNYRCGMVGGNLTINSQPNGGTTIKCTFQNTHHVNQ
jgi:signal transduction histidine kinase